MSPDEKLSRAERIGLGAAINERAKWTHAAVVAYIEGRGCKFERYTQRGKWRYLLFDKYPIEIPGPAISYEARQWGNVREQARKEIDRAYERAGDRPDAIALLNAPTTPEAPATVEQPVEPAPVVAPVVETAPPADAPPATSSSTTRKTLQFVDCPVEGCTQRAAGKHLLYHINRGELPKGYKLRGDKSPSGSQLARMRERGTLVAAPVHVNGTSAETSTSTRARKLRPHESAPLERVIVGPTSRAIAELQDRATPHVASLREQLARMDDAQRSYRARIDEEVAQLEEIVRDVLKIAADQETTMRLMAREHSELQERWNQMASAFSSRTLNAMHERR